MTPDKHAAFIEKINAEIRFINDVFYKPHTASLAIRDLVVSRLYSIRGVAELHKPVIGCDEHDACADFVCESCDTDYPCATTKAIEAKEKSGE